MHPGTHSAAIGSSGQRLFDFAVGDKVEVRHNNGYTRDGRDLSSYLFRGEVIGSVDETSAMNCLAIRSENGETYHVHFCDLRRISG